MPQCPEASSQKTFGSRLVPCGTATGVPPSYVSNVFPPSLE